MKKVIIVALIHFILLPAIADDDATDGGYYDKGFIPRTTEFGVGEIEEGVDLFSGSSTITMPLATLKGVAGFEYDLNISYNSSAATAYTDPGTFGNGWFFSHPYIARESTAVLTSEVVFSDDEENYKYWLILPEGSFEIRLTGVASPDVHEWTTKINSGISITSTGDTEEWDTFTVTTKDGTEYTFEQGMFGFYNYPERCDSRLYQAQLFWEDMPLRWNITSIADVYGNCITYDYNNYTHYATNSLATRITDPPLELHDGRCYYGISVKLLDYIKLENTHTSLTQNVLINYEDRDDMEWEAAHGHGSSIEDIWDTSYFNYGPTETDYPKRISSVVVNEPKSSGVNTIMYAYKFEYDNAVGYFYTFHRDGSEHEDWNQVPRQMLTDLKLYGSDYVPDDPSIVPIAITSFEYDAFDWDSYSLQDGEVTVPCHPDWEPNYTINALYVGQEYNDVGFSYGVKNIKLPYSGNITFHYHRKMYPDIDDVNYEPFPEVDDYSCYSLEYAIANKPLVFQKYWVAVVDYISNKNGITTYSYEESKPYDYTIVDPGNMSGDNWKIVDSDMAFTEVHANKEDMGMTTITHFYYPQTTYNYDTDKGEILIIHRTIEKEVFFDENEISDFLRVLHPYVGTKIKEEYVVGPTISEKTEYSIYTEIVKPDQEIGNSIDDRLFIKRTEEENSYVYGSTCNTHSRIHYEYEDEYNNCNYENVTSAVDYSNLSVQQDEVYKEYTYYHSNSQQSHSLWLTEKVYSSDNPDPTSLVKSTERVHNIAPAQPPYLEYETKYVLDSDNTYLKMKYNYNTINWNLANERTVIPQAPGYIKEIEYTYDSLGLQRETETQVRDNPIKPSLTTATYYYNNTLKEREIDENGNVTGYLYDEYGRTIAIWRPGDDGFDGANSDPEGAGVRVTYYDVALNPEQPYQQTMIEVDQPDGVTQKIIFSYDGFGRPVRRYSPNNAEGYTVVEEFEYLGDKESVHNGPVEVSGIYGPGQWPETIDWREIVTTTEYDFMMRETTKTTYGKVVEYSYDVVEIDGIPREIKLMDIGGDGQNVYCYVYDSRDNIISFIYDYGGPEELRYDYEYDVLGNLTAVIEPSVSGHQAITTMSYDGLGRLIEQHMPSPTIQGYNAVTEYVYEPYTGDLVYYRDPNLKDDGLWQRTEYDDLGRPLFVALVSYTGDDPLNEAPSQSLANLYTYKYDNYGAFSYGQVLTPPAGETYFSPADYDNALGRLTVLTNYTDDEADVQNIYAYDTRGNLLRDRQIVDGTYTFDTDYWYDNLDNVTKIQYPSGNWVFRDYDELLRLESIRGERDDDPVTYVSDIDYNSLGLMTRMDYPNGCETIYNYDGAELTQIRADLTAADPHYFQLDTFEDLSFPQDLTFSWGHVINNFSGWGFGVSRVVETSGAEPPPTANSDSFMEISLRKEIIGTATGPSLIGGPRIGDAAHWWLYDTIEYDVCLTGDGDPDDIAGTWELEIVNDEGGYYAVDLFYSTSVPPSLLKNHWYHIEVPIVGTLINPQDETWSWGDIDYIRLRRYPDHLPDIDEEQNIYLDNLELTCEETVFNTLYTYNDENQIIEISSQPFTGPAADHELRHSYTYDARGQLLSHHFDEITPSPDSFTKYIDHWGYVYDDRGNRTNLSYDSWRPDQDGGAATIQSTEALAYQDHTNRITEQLIDAGNPEIDFVLDYNGNVTSTSRNDGTNLIIYDYSYGPGDRMEYLSIHDTVLPPTEYFGLECGYDAEGLRTRRKLYEGGAAVEERRYVWGADGLLLAEYLWDGDSYELSREYVNDANGVVATLDYDFTPGAGAEVGWHLRDHLGSTYAVIAAPVLTVPYGDPLKIGQRILWTGHYEAFGRPDSLRPVCPGYFPNPIQYTGYYSDGDIFEHYYAKARYYDPYTGRFLGRDPADFDPGSFPGAVNRYTYAANNPLRYVDPDGRFFFLPLLLAGVDLFQWSALAYIALDAGIAGYIEAARGGDFGDFVNAISQQLISGVLMYSYAAAFSAIYNPGESVLSFRSTINAISTTSAVETNFLRMTQTLNVTGAYLSWGQQSVLNLSGASRKWGSNWLPLGLHHGWGGYASGAIGLIAGGPITNVFQTITALLGSGLAVDDFIQHLFQVISNDPTAHSAVHLIWENYKERRRGN